jgi:hypothetical protein
MSSSGLWWADDDDDIKNKISHKTAVIEDRMGQ